MRTLARLFREHPVWVEAARGVDGRAESAVYFTHVPDRAWRLLRRGGRTRLIPGLARDPDFAFRFTPGAVVRLAAVRGGVGDFAVELFARIADRRRAERVDFRVVAPFGRLVRRGYVRMLLSAGPKVLAFGLAHGVRTPGDLRALVERTRRATPARWERPAAAVVRTRS